MELICTSEFFKLQFQLFEKLTSHFFTFEKPFPAGFRTTFLSLLYMISLAYKISHCLSANHHPELRCVICTGVTLFALVLHLNCTALSQSESSNFFMCVIRRVINTIASTWRLLVLGHYLFLKVQHFSSSFALGKLFASPELIMSVDKYPSLVYTTQVNSTFRAR